MSKRNNRLLTMPTGSPKPQEPSGAGQGIEKIGKQTLQRGYNKEARRRKVINSTVNQKAGQEEWRQRRCWPKDGAQEISMNNKGQGSRKGSAAFLLTVRYENAFYFLHIFNLCSLLIYNSHIFTIQSRKSSGFKCLHWVVQTLPQSMLECFHCSQETVTTILTSP